MKADRPDEASGILRPVVFGPWQPLAEALVTAPLAPGVLQVRGDRVLDLPLGKSAMILYAASAAGESLADFVAGAGAPLLVRAAGRGALYVRFAPAEAPGAALTRLLDRFRERFGALPAVNQDDPPGTGS